MNNKSKINFSSLKDLAARLIRVFYGPAFFMTLKNTDPIFREKLLITVSMSNECGG